MSILTAMEPAVVARRTAQGAEVIRQGLGPASDEARLVANLAAVEVRFCDSGRFALEAHAHEMATAVCKFLGR